MVYLFWPETSNKTLEEIAAVFGDEVAVDINEAIHSADTKPFANEKNVSPAAEVQRVEDVSDVSGDDKLTH